MLSMLSSYCISIQFNFTIHLLFFFFCTFLSVSSSHNLVLVVVQCSCICILATLAFMGTEQRFKALPTAKATYSPLISSPAFDSSNYWTYVTCHSPDIFCAGASLSITRQIIRAFEFVPHV